MAVGPLTPGRIFLGAGDLTYGTVNIGATVEDTILRIELEQYFPDFNGTKGPVDGTGFILEAIPYLEATLTELRGQFLGWGLPGVTVVSGVSSEVISDYQPHCKPMGQDLVWTGQDCDGHDITITLYNAIVESNLELPFSDNEIVKFRYTWKGLYDLAAPGTAPISIVIDIA